MGIEGTDAVGVVTSTGILVDSRSKRKAVDHRSLFVGDVLVSALVPWESLRI